MPSHSPPEPKPITARDAMYPDREPDATKPSVPPATTAKAASSVVRAPNRRTMPPPATNPASMPIGKLATTNPATSGLERVLRASAGRTGPMML